MNLILISVIIFLLITNIVTLRIFWFIIGCAAYISYVEKYYLDFNLTKDESYNEYLQIWPMSSIILRFWQWNFRDFVVDQEKYDSIIRYIQRQQKNNARNNQNIS